MSLTIVYTIVTLSAIGTLQQLFYTLLPGSLKYTKIHGSMR